MNPTIRRLASLALSRTPRKTGPSLWLWGLSILAGCTMLVGCGGEPPPPGNPPPPTALSLAEWKTLPIPEKYDGGTLDRLRMHDPKLATDQAWDAFMRKEVIPERMQDIPGKPGVLPPEANK